MYVPIFDVSESSQHVSLAMDRTFVTLRADSEPSEFPTFTLASQIKSVGEFASIPLLAETSLVMLANEMTYTCPLVGRCVMTIWARRAARTVTFAVVLADRSVEFCRIAEVVCVSEEGKEGQLRHALCGWVEDLVRQRGLNSDGSHD